MTAARFSVVVPAHDEERVIGRCLAFVRELSAGETEVVVAANGCQDGTVARAQEVPGVTVLDLPAPGKVGALNAGDAACSVFPRIYLDADIVVDAATLRLLADRLRGPEALVASPRVTFDTRSRPWAVRAFYDIYGRLPYVADGLIGLGIYAVSASGRQRWPEFPPVTADDLFVQRLFAPHERVIVAERSFEVQTPRTLRDLLRVRTRTVFGNNELAATEPSDTTFATTQGNTQRALVRHVRQRPSRLPAAVVYTGVMLEARRRARGRAGSSWHRDASTR
jgi:glycosyltransferase involved in cell wall biosynthesis